MNNLSKNKLIEKKKEVINAQKELSKAVKIKKNQLRRELTKLKRDIRQTDSAVLTRDTINKMINNSVKEVKNTANHNRVLIYITLILSSAGFVYLYNEKKDKN